MGMNENRRRSCRREKGIFQAHDFSVRVQASRIAMKVKQLLKVAGWQTLRPRDLLKGCVDEEGSPGDRERAGNARKTCCT